VATGNTHTVLLLDNGTVFGWGDVDRLGQREVGHFSFLPIQIPISAPVSFIACGSDFTLCVAEGGQVWSWGKGTSGNLGHGVALDEYTPKCIESIQDTSVYMVAAGSSHSLALTRQVSRFYQKLVYLIVFEGCIVCMGPGRQRAIGHWRFQESVGTCRSISSSRYVR